jgi:hypothetical protein
VAGCEEVAAPVQSSFWICQPLAMKGNGSVVALLIRVWGGNFLGGFGAYILQLGAQGLNLG